MAEALALTEYSLGYVTIQGGSDESLPGFSGYALGVVTLTGTSSGMMRSMRPISFSSFAVIFITLAASAAFALSFQRMDAKPSGERIE